MTTAISSSTATTATSSTGAVSAQEQTDRFMKLLVAQLNNQDPMNPMDNAQMTSQIAQINTVSGIQELNETMKSMAAQFTSMQVLQGASMVGHGVLVESGTLSIDSGVAKGAVNLASKADKVTIDIKTAGGQLLDTVNLGSLPAGQTSFQWDASKYSGLTNVTFKVTATQGGQAVKTTSLAQDTVTAVGTDNGAMSLQLKGRSAVAYSAVKSIL
ncbi:flagellar hook assembly protein FlgD [Rhodoferax mekongensis]|uniref:Basal-body rod modification protein FlgD n=1 Tax=Rhodoferax mekongensis TaxID=3068341 RepID=A0ABZ0AZ27_9BURK|nr:flagellar hook capping FlgD N-terminal domain-containing protein [Rhodoferax sp. TBRC 17307]WNO04918.1 flagellar hook capping FlgD N-terminal domain-containing protein [Rhodoferax sp. TBRC 17307]